MDRTDIIEVLNLCNAPLERGCDPDDKAKFDEMTVSIHGDLFVPCGLNEAKQLYVALRSAL